MPGPPPARALLVVLLGATGAQVAAQPASEAGDATKACGAFGSAWSPACHRCLLTNLICPDVASPRAWHAALMATVLSAEATPVEFSASNIYFNTDDMVDLWGEGSLCEQVSQGRSGHWV